MNEGEIENKQRKKEKDNRRMISTDDESDRDEERSDKTERKKEMCMRVEMMPGSEVRLIAR